MSTEARTIKVLHYLNPFFAGIGGEESNDLEPRVERGSRGPGRLLDKLLEGKGQVVATLICGDNFFMAHEDRATEVLANAVKDYRPDLVIAGPAFNAGRYGLACGAICEHASDHLGVPAVTAMSVENPGSEFRRKKVYIFPTGDSVKSMGEVLPRVVQFGIKLVGRQVLRPAEEEGHLPRGMRFNERVAKSSAQRAVDAVVAKVRNQPYHTEIRLEAQELVAPPTPHGPLNEAVLALVTEMGFCPHGNPDRIASARAKVWGHYSISGMNRASSDRFMYIHGGYNTNKVDEDPNRGVPVDALREVEKEGGIKALIDDVFSTCGNGGSLNEMKRIGEEMAREVKRRGATAVILPAT
jgi:glycine reductase complex component B subunit gamma